MLAHYNICSKCPPYAERKCRRHCLSALSISCWSKCSHLSQLIHIFGFLAVNPLLPHILLRFGLFGSHSEGGMNFMKSDVRRLSRSTVSCVQVPNLAGSWSNLRTLFDVGQKFFLHEENFTAFIYTPTSMKWRSARPMPTLRQTPSTNCWMFTDSVTSNWVECPFGHRLTSSFSENI